MYWFILVHDLRKKAKGRTGLASALYIYIYLVNLKYSIFPDVIVAQWNLTRGRNFGVKIGEIYFIHESGRMTSFWITIGKIFRTRKL